MRRSAPGLSDLKQALASDEAVPSPWPHVVVRGELGLARQEWLHTNGAGAFASSTVAAMHTRRYHGLLVAALDPPRGRHVMLSHVDVGVDPNEPGVRRRPKWELGMHQFPSVDPEDTAFYLACFDQDPLPRWTYEVGGGQLEVCLALVRGENAVVLRYRWQGPQSVRLTLRPLLAVRHMHTLLRENGGMSNRVELRVGTAADGATYNEVRVQPNRLLPRLCFRYQGTFVGSPDWWRRFEYLREQERGLDFQEDLWTPGHVDLVAEPGSSSYLVVAVESLPEGEPEALLQAARAAIQAEDPGPSAPVLVRRLSIAAEAFRCDEGANPGVIAGYPWFEVWGRYALIALPGLYLVPGKVDGAIRVLRGLIEQMQGGLAPNRLPDSGGAPEYHAADATLWLFEAARQLVDVVGEEHPFVVEELLPALQSAFEAVLHGTRHDVHLSADGLFAAGRKGEALTWMDAQVRGEPVTPRVGCPVELQALWAKGAETLARIARAAGDDALATRAEAAAQTTRKAFQRRFWCEDTGYPYDVISAEEAGVGAVRDATIRPNALIALAVDPDCFTPDQATALLERVRLELLTPAGVRSLSPADPSYVRWYVGNAEERDKAYHQGAVWPWLLGFYARAARRSSSLGEHVLPLLRRFLASAAGNALALGFVAELCDGEPPHTPRGCVAHAAGVAELLRALLWDLPDGEPSSG
ncbi:amylo-alpha-1,6-glucosidase [Chondromyces crocatus]|uniref:4-alpha-glucanotransferase n=1 Tax=Chondromyces crocatus TaxID=52 RepID=A0A0K1EG31_CHOCO|nr:amylo-alpha-1,6-glucosidase [Chondromyces crocatus]AKT39804.1 4-alpha-glucanotransferase [Chondromyces crocatus]